MVRHRVEGRHFECHADDGRCSGIWELFRSVYVARIYDVCDWIPQYESRLSARVGTARAMAIRQRGPLPELPEERADDRVSSKYTRPVARFGVGDLWDLWAGPVDVQAPDDQLWPTVGAAQR